MTDPAPAVIVPIRRTRLVDEVADHLRTLILTDQLAPGHQLRQVEMADRLSVSRTPLREALRVLESEGLVRTSNGLNTVEVVDHSAGEARKLFEVREVIDGLASRILAQRGLTRDAADDLELLAHRLERATDPYDQVNHSRSWASLFCAILVATGNRRIAAQQPMVQITSQVVSRQLHRLMADDASADERAAGEELLAVIVAAVKGLLAAINAGDAVKAEAIARRHARSVVNIWAR